MDAIDFAGFDLGAQLHRGRSLVYRATRQSDGLPVVLKLLADQHPSPQLLGKFQREFELTRQLHDVDGAVQALSLERRGHRWAMVVEDFGGESLDRLQLAGHLSMHRFVEIAIGIADALGQLHARDVIHKDVNPSNIVLNPDSGQIKLIDFGTSTVLQREATQFGSPARLEGTLPYISPEQTGRINRSVDLRTDLYSLGVTLYELLTGRLPFRDSDSLSIVHSHIARSATPPAQINTEIPPTLSSIIMRLLEKDADSRYQTADGLRADLERFAGDLKKGVLFGKFNLGQHDQAGAFRVSERIYGRDTEVRMLLSVFDTVSAGGTELMLVGGYSGVGKSSLVQEIYRPVTEKRGFFVRGKYDQYQQNIPYAGFIQAFQALLDHVLAESEEQIWRWKGALGGALGELGQVALDLLPELEHIIGPQPPVRELQGREAQNRFNIVLQRFMAVFAAADHPLVIFLDDLHWADERSLSLIELLMTSPQSHHLFIVGAFREHEVGPGHRLTVTTERLEKDGLPVRRMSLEPLRRTDCDLLVADTLRTDSKTVKPLAEVVFAKTRGNPYFVGVFLESMHDEGIIRFDRKTSRWEWDANKLVEQDVTENVVSMMTTNLRRLPPNTQEALKIASCLGSEFDAEVVAAVMGLPEREVASALWPAVSQGNVMPRSNDYQLLDVDVEGLRETLRAEYTFAHDRVQQAAYTLIQEEMRPALHWRIGRSLVQATAERGREEALFAIANHLNRGHELATPGEMEELIRLNLEASRRAKQTVAFGLAFEYIEAAVRYMVGGGMEERASAEALFQERPDEAAHLYVEAVDLAYLSTQFDVLETLAELVLALASDPVTLARVYEVKIQARFAQGQPLDAVSAGLDILRQLDNPLPEEPTQEDIGAALGETTGLMEAREVEDLLDLPLMTDEKTLAVMRILTSLIPAAFIAAPPLFPMIVMSQVRLSITEGNAPQSPVAYASFGLILCGVVGDIDTGYRFGEVADQLLGRLDAKERYAMTVALVACGTRHWKQKIIDTQAPLPQAYHVGVDTGDLEYAAIALEIYCYNAYFIGTELTELERELARYSEAMRNIRQERIYQLNEVYRQATLNLMGRSEDPCVLTGEAGDEEAWRQRHTEAGDQSALGELYLHKTILLNYFGRYAEAAEWADLAVQGMAALPGFAHNPVFAFHDSLVQLGRYQDVGPEQREVILARVADNQKKLGSWAEHAPQNQLHRYHLVEAELARVRGDDSAAIHYQQSIELAQEHAFLHEEGLAQELAGRYHRSMDQAGQASDHLRNARYAFELWGASAKTEDIDAKYGAISGPRRAHARHHTLSTTVDQGIDLDLEAVLRGSQAISSEVALDAVLTRIMALVLESAGATRCVLLLKEGKNLLIQAEGSLDEGIEVMGGTSPLARPSSVPMHMVNYVMRTGRSRVINNPSAEPHLLGEEYLKTTDAKSIMCAPLDNKGDLVGVLYLENGLTAGAFTAEMLEALRILSAQAAISVVNARLYAGLEAVSEAQSRFVPYQFLDSLAHGDIGEVELGDYVAKTMTVMFADLRKFMPLAERLGPERSIETLNAYFAAMEPCIHDNGGFIDSFNGDEIMALFDGEPDRAVRAAIEMSQALDRLNAMSIGGPQLRMGIGINTGEVLLGVVGASNRIKCGVVGHAVNAASRIEQLTKTYGTRLLIGDSTFGSLHSPEMFSIRTVDQVAMADNQSPTTLYQVLDAELDESRAEKEASRGELVAAVQRYYAQDFTGAAEALQSLAQRHPEDRVIEIFATRARSLAETPPPEGWSGVAKLEYHWELAF